jgi:hypothetical protein
MLILLKIDTSTPSISIFIKWFLIQTIKTHLIKQFTQDLASFLRPVLGLIFRFRKTFSCCFA